MNIRGGNWLEGSYSGGFSVISNSRIATGDHVSVGVRMAVPLVSTIPYIDYTKRRPFSSYFGLEFIALEEQDWRELRDIASVAMVKLGQGDIK